MILRSRILPLALMTVVLLSCKTAERGYEVGNLAQSLRLSDINGHIVDLDSLRGNVVLINFWSYT